MSNLNIDFIKSTTGLILLAEIVSIDQFHGKNNLVRFPEFFLFCHIKNS